MVKVLLCVWYNLPGLRNIGVGVDLLHLSRRLHTVVKIVYAPVSIRVYYMPFARTPILLWKFLYQTQCNMYANMHGLGI